MVGSGVGDAAPNDRGKWGHPVFFDLPVGNDMADPATPNRECVGDQRAMAAPVQGLGAHDGGPNLSGDGPQLVKTAGELIGLHVVSKGTEARVAPAAVGGSLAGTLPEASQLRKMDILEPRCGEGDPECLAVELRRMTRAGDGPDIREANDLGGPEETKEILEASCRVSDGVEVPDGCFHSSGSF